ncbi:hypothetical protein ACJJTC_007115 [Scirpophaga incertulas]
MQICEELAVLLTMQLTEASAARAAQWAGVDPSLSTCPGVIFVVPRLTNLSVYIFIVIFFWVGWNMGVNDGEVHPLLLLEAAERAEGPRGRPLVAGPENLTRN